MSAPRFVVLDFELTSRTLEEAYIVEWAAVVVTPHWFGSGGPEPAVGSLIRPPIPIPPETSAIHQIVDADVADAPTWADETARVESVLGGEGTVIVAHSADTERAILDVALPARWLCTYKAALRVWPDAPSHSNEGLRYWLGLGTGRSQPQAPHSAAHDATVTAQILLELLKTGANPEDMIKWTDEPTMLPRCPIGNYRGMKWADIPDEGFLEWILRKIHDREDLRFCARMELDRREAERQELRAVLGSAIAAAAIEDDEDIPF